MKRAWKAPRQARQREATGAAGATDSITGAVGADIVCHATTAAAIEDVMLAFIVNRFCFESLTLYPNYFNRQTI